MQITRSPSRIRTSCSSCRAAERRRRPAWLGTDGKHCWCKSRRESDPIRRRAGAAAHLRRVTSWSGCRYEAFQRPARWTNVVVNITATDRAFRHAGGPDSQISLWSGRALVVKSMHCMCAMRLFECQKMMPSHLTVTLWRCEARDGRTCRSCAHEMKLPEAQTN